MVRISLLSTLLAILATLWFWQGLPEDVDNALALKELPQSLQHLNLEQTLELPYQSGIQTRQIGNEQLTLIGGQFEQRFSVCEKASAKDHQDKITASHYIYVGLELAQLKALDKDFSVKKTFINRVQNPIIDQSNTSYDIPGFAIKYNENTGHSIKLLEANVQLIVDNIEAYDDEPNFIKHGFISNDDFTIVATKKQISRCKFNEFDFDIYRHSQGSNDFVYFLDDFTNLNSEHVKGSITAGSYPPPSITKYGVQSLVEQMQACEQIKEEDGEWQYASRYHYNNQTPLDGFSPIKTEHCKKVLATFYHTPAGNVVRKRAVKISNYAKPLIAISGDNLVNVAATHNEQPLAIKQKPLSLYQNLLIKNEDINKKMLWHKVHQDKATFTLPPLEQPTSIYILGKNISVSGTKVLARSEQCFNSLCDKKSDVTWLKLAPTSGEVIIEVSGILQTAPLLQQNIAQLTDKPSLQHSNCNQVCKAERAERIANGEVNKFSVVDRNNQKLSVADIPHLLAPRGGRINAAMGNNIQLTIDKSTQESVQSILEDYMSEIEIDAAFATLSIVNADGEILALAQTASVNENINYEREGYQQSYRPFDSPLTFKAAYHDGSSNYVSGSVMKLLSALMITDELGINHPYIKGMSFDQWYQQRHKTQMNPKLGCYPTYKSRCVKNSISNFTGPTGISTIKKYTIDKYIDKSVKYGLKEATRDSLNSYFSFMVSKVANEPIYEHLAFGEGSYAKSSKLRDFISQFGFYSPLKLDAGLLGGHEKNTVFYVPASQLSHTKEEQFWRAAVGEQNKVTALQVAQFTLAIANKKLTPLTLLKSIDDETAKLEKQSLNIKPEAFNLVQSAMKLAAKKYDSFKDLPPHISLYAKTGTGEIGKKDEYKKSLNNVWMTAYINPESPVVMTCQISQVKGLSTLCAKLINKLLENADKIPALGLASTQKQGIADVN